MRLLILADMDEFYWHHGHGHADAVISCGDIFDQLILEAADAYACRTIFAVKGNHDGHTRFPDPIVDVHRKVEEYMGLRFGGINGSWKYKTCGPFLYTQRQVSSFLSVLPGVDIFISHNSPRGIHDREDKVHAGFIGLRAYIIQMRPKLVVHGHQHLNSESRLGNTVIVGVHGYRLMNI